MDIGMQTYSFSNRNQYMQMQHKRGLGGSNPRSARSTPQISGVPRASSQDKEAQAERSLGLFLAHRNTEPWQGRPRLS